MNETYIGLGSNLGDRRQNIAQAIERIKKVAEPGSVRLSSVYETPALLPEGSPDEWNMPYLNMVLEAKFPISCEELLKILQGFEAELGRDARSQWSPRTIDLDILFSGDRVIDTPTLRVPHPRFQDRAFVLDPLKDLNLKFLSQAKAHSQHTPVWMGVINLTPDSFSDGGEWRMDSLFHSRLDEWDSLGVGIVDIGGESTRPGARPVDPNEEWRRIKPALEELNDRYRGKILRPLISVDTYHSTTAARAVKKGVDIINDVSGLVDPEMVELLQGTNVQYVLMHTLGVPADPKQVLRAMSDPVLEILTWFRRKTVKLEASGIAPERIILDPGIGFGKTALQSIHVLKYLDEFKDLPYRLMVGHSRKSFLNPFSQVPPHERDIESVGVSLNLANKGVDILRVHNPALHIRAFRACNHLNQSVHQGNA